LGSDTERKTIQGINPTEPQIIPFEPFDQLPALRWCYRRDLLVVQFERGRPLNLPARSLVSLAGRDRRSGWLRDPAAAIDTVFLSFAPLSS
jgi:hypothetical protein